MIRKYLLPVALLLGVVWDVLFWGIIPGISFPVFVILCLVTGYFLLRSEGIYPSKNSYLLIGLILLFSFLTFVRKDSLTSFANYAFSILFTLLLSTTYINGAWVNFNLVDYIRKSFYLLGKLIILPWKFIFSDGNSHNGEKTKSKTSIVFPIMRGLLLSVPILIVFTLLLSSADMIFSQGVKDFLQYFNIEKFKDYFTQGIFIFAIAYIFIGLIRFSEKYSQKTNASSVGKSVIRPSLGFTEGLTILSVVMVLFIVFVIIQFRYFFSGVMNINAAGFTYSEYARRGFGELVWVAIFCLMLIQSIKAVLKTESLQQRRILTGMIIGLVLLNLVILTSSFQRLSLYESAYGFSLLRTYSHVFIIWLGLLLISVIMLELIKKPRLFTNAILLAMVGFALSLNILNVDSFIAHQNAKRAEMGLELDIHYLATLSSDAVPQLVKEFNSTEHSSRIHNEIGMALACHNNSLETYDKDLLDNGWQSFHYADWKANKELQAIQIELGQYQIIDDGFGPKVVNPNGFDIGCQSYMGMD